ncbi:MAG: hypothetical protein R3D33_07990 [Hyphomicrobiaceae bacterium]
MGPGYPDDVHGIAAPGDGWLDIAARWVDGGIEFDVGSPGGAGGRIAVSLERVLERFEVDTGRGEGMSAGGGPDLYKEWRMIGRAELSGALFTATSPAKARLILQGGGNLCTSAESFARWMLILKGGGADFALLGETVRAGDGN